MLKNNLSQAEFNERVSNLPSQNDYLTGISNRYGFMDYYKQLDHDANVHIIYIDIVNFKKINETFCYSTGDWILKKISELLQIHFKDEFVARIGGDEFVVILGKPYKKQDILTGVKQFLQQINMIDEKEELKSLLILSIGILYDEKVGQSIDELLSKCDVVTYNARVYSDENHFIYEYKGNEADINASIEAEFHEAMENEYIKAYLQPKINIVTKKVVGAEALARWEHPVYGLRTPDKFIPLLEESGSIVELDLFIFEQVCKFKQSLRNKSYSTLPMSINISRVHLWNKSFPDQLDAIAKKYGIDNKELELEVTESIYINDKTELISTTERLREKGFSVSLDDFGSGFSALNLLKDIPANIIKLDRGFLLMADNDDRGKKVLKNIIYMCRDLKYDIVTEGVETEEQVQYVLKSGCPVAQGYYFAKPMNMEDFIQFCEKQIVENYELVEFSFHDTLESVDGKYKGVFIPEHPQDTLLYQEGVNKNTRSVYFPGGSARKNIVKLPNELLLLESYTIVMWIKPEILEYWGSALYVNYETGFMTITPYGADEETIFRIRDAKILDSYYDTLTECNIKVGEWHHIAITFNADSERTELYIDGEFKSSEENVVTMHYTRNIFLGGDIYKNSFKGNISELKFYNEVKDGIFIKKLYKSYFVDAGNVELESR